VTHGTGIESPSSLMRGRGIHSGRQSSVRFYPSDLPCSGIMFRHAATGGTVLAEPRFVTATRRCTTIGNESASFATVEHVMSACYGLGITDLIVEVGADEVPILDGSALPFVDALMECGITASGEQLDPVRIAEPVVIQGVQGEIVTLVPAEFFRIALVVDYPGRAALGTRAVMYSNGNYNNDVAPARTYGFISEINALIEQGLASGADFDSGVALLDDGSPDERTPLRFPDEPARHKLLDLLGDLYLVQRHLLADIVAVRPSHTVNTLVARHIEKIVSNYSNI